MRNHYTLENLKRAIQNPHLFGRELHRLFSLPIHRAYGRYVDRKVSGSEPMMERDWDNLLILDACRFDYFEAQNRIDGDLSKVISPGKMSWEFMQEEFVGNTFHDTVYITANTFATQLSEDIFFKTVYLNDQWDDEIGTIYPAHMVEAAREAHEQYPNKRLIVHFMQPHRPYLGPTADRLRDRVDLVGLDNDQDGIQIWGAVKQKNVTASEIRRAYSETLDIVLDHAADLIEALDGKSVITSDHGEMLGERVFPFTTRVWGHMEGFDTPLLREVPWLAVESATRRDVVESEPIGAEYSVSESEVEEQLEALGYK